jgi:hypothetical protein
MRRSVFDQMLVDMRSGEFKKAQGHLCTRVTDTELGYCCLGLITNRSGLGEFVESGHSLEARAYETRNGYRNVYNLPNDVKEWAGCNTERGARIRLSTERLSEVLRKIGDANLDSETFYLDEINDWKEKSLLTFSEQADLFEAHREQIVTPSGETQEDV